MSLSRRMFLGVPPLLSVLPLPAGSTSEPWYRRAVRWGQTNITEKDPERYDIAWWRQYWKRTEVQGVIINAGGIVAYYPSRFPLQYRAAYLHGRDLYGELAKAAHDDGLVVLARMDSNRATEEFYRAHPDWFAVRADGKPHRAGERYVACINGPYYQQFLPTVMQEIIERSRAEGLTDNSWAGLGRDGICYCSYCRELFRAKAGQDLPARKDWDDHVYREWILWSYERRLAIWDLNNRTTKAAGGPDCLWIGMNSGSVSGESATFRDLREICKRAEMLLLDHQRRDDNWGFAENADTGKRVHALLGWNKLAPESMAMYGAAPNSFRLAAKPAEEARMWMFAGFAGGIQPWWHHIGAYQEDRRAYHTAEPAMRWHKANERYLFNRLPVATVGLVWSQRCTDFFGRDAANDRTESPYRGMAQALVRARIPYVPVHIDDISHGSEELTLLILPNIGAMSSAQCAAVRSFVERGGSLLATGVTSLYDEWGDARPDFGLHDVFGVRRTPALGAGEDAERRRAATYHTYLRISPELRARVEGPHPPGEPSAAGVRHPVLRGFEETDILAYGGILDPLTVESGALVPLTYIPPFPVYPPEFAYMREERTTVPGLVMSEHRAGGRIAFLPADLDRRYSRDHLPDHAALLANVVRWCARDRIPLRVEGPGLLDCELYRQPGRLILHILNLTNEAAWRQPMDELIAVGPLQVSVRLSSAVKGLSARELVNGSTLKTILRDGWASFELPRITDHEVVVIE